MRRHESCDYLECKNPHGIDYFRNYTVIYRQSESIITTTLEYLQNFKSRRKIYPTETASTPMVVTSDIYEYIYVNFFHIFI